MSEYDESQLPDLLPIYYKRLFPHHELCCWLSLGKYNSYNCFKFVEKVVSNLNLNPGPGAYLFCHNDL